ncbi:MAG: hypothetical protein FWE23_04270 [Chitinivibrionia bacterium]|nr:hypothetical protein [Chitinivibrionia bacterium]
MRRKSILAVGATLALAATVMGQAQFTFPSPWNPAGRPANQVPQFIAITWDDNAYSGMTGTGYETEPGATFAQQHFVGWRSPEPGAPGVFGPTCVPTPTVWSACRPNAFNIVESNPTGNQIMMGMSWSLRAFPEEVRMTYFMLAGFYVNVWSERSWAATGVQPWQSTRSALGWFTGEELGDPVVNPNASDAQQRGYETAAVAWGREHGSRDGGGTVTQNNTIYAVTRAAMQRHHEIANHSLDHMEANSWIPGGNHKDAALGFGRWGGEGFTNQEELDTTDWGQVINRTTEWGMTGVSLNRGWRAFAGRQLSFNAWRGAINLSDDWIKRGNGGDSREGGANLGAAAIRGWRAPRLESNSNMFFALKAQGYLYSSTLEDGHEMHVTGQNFLWPHTLDNGNRNSWTQADRGARVFLDTMPTGLWEIPLNVVIVPETHRQGVTDNWNMINRALRAGGKSELPDRDASTWDGKITAFDFNLFVHHAMTPAQFVATLQNTINLRMGPGGNRAPFNWGTHTDYYTPIYDNGTLLNDFNRNDYGLVLTRNTWRDRISATEQWVNWALGLNNPGNQVDPLNAGPRGRQAVQFVTGQELIAAVNAMNTAGQAAATRQTPIANSSFTLWRDANNEGTELGTGQQFLTAGPNRAGQQPKFVHSFARGTYNDMTHISLSYRSRTATAVRLIRQDADGNALPVREVILAHRFPQIGWNGIENTNFETPRTGTNDADNLRASGMIPLTSFDFEQYFEGTRNYSSINPADIVGIEIAPLAPANVTPLHGQTPTFAERLTDFELGFHFANIVIHRGTPFQWDADDLPPPAGITNRVGRAGARALSIAGLTTNSLRLNIAQAGTYNIGIYTVNGRQIQSFRGETLSAGMNTLNLNNLARGVHVVRIQGVNNNQQLVRQVIVR